MKTRTLILIFLFLLIFPGFTYAHRVSVFAYQEGNRIFVEGFFSDGTPTRQAAVEVFDQGGRKLFSGQTDQKGTLSFKAPRVDSVKIVLGASMGHRAETLFRLARSAAGKAATVKPAADVFPKVPVPSQVDQTTETRLRMIVQQEVSKAIQPIMRTLARQEARKISFSDIIGGIGWIVGLMGIWMFLKAKGKR